MLSAHHRLRASRDFAAVLRGGRRGSSSTLIVYAVVGGGSDAPARVGFAVSRAVGNAVVRHRVARRLRAMMSARMGEIAPGTLVVVRALPGASSASHAHLGVDLDKALSAAGV
jgi:ribonuclease P protein component